MFRALDAFHLFSSRDGLHKKDGFASICESLLRLKENRTTVYAIGGSKSSSFHFCLELIKNAQVYSSLLLDLQLMSEIGNVCRLDEVYLNTLQVMLKEDDLAVVLARSGTSKNILNVVVKASENGNYTITMSGCSPVNSLR